eukprot:TRINITY_DN36206_c0_g1_i1.p2 TRINITY_DN36206_c0_g1~~TRINITY_DN36206_c0_g1_i1.p2  ORF type:complete len:127 (+),score=56.49 TRINITY_DN36206_c0_g1_i1:59-439(+)
MVLLTSVEDFGEAAERMYRETPDKARYSFKYRHSDAKFFLKVTDNKAVYTFRSQELSDLWKLERLHAMMLSLFADKEWTGEIEQPQPKGRSGSPGAQGHGGGKPAHKPAQKPGGKKKQQQGQKRKK